MGIVSILVLALIVNRCTSNRRPVQSKDKTNICTPSVLYEEGSRRYKSGHLMGQWFIPRKCVAISFDDYMDDLSVPVSIRKMPSREMLLRLEAALELGSVEVNNLRILRLGRCGLGDEHIQSLLKLLKMKQVSSTLRELHLNGNHLTDKGLSALLEGIKTNKKVVYLKALNLERNKIGHEGMKALLTHVTTNVVLHYEDLYLADNPAWNKGNKQLGEVLKWMPISQNDNRVRTLKGSVRVHVGTPETTRSIVTEAHELAAETRGDRSKNRGRASNIGGGRDVSAPPSGTRAVAGSEMALLQRGLPGMRTVLPWSHALFSTTNYSIAHGATQPSVIETGEWERESEVVMRLFVEDCLGDSERLKMVSSGIYRDTAAFATHLAGLGHRTPSSLIHLNSEDLQDHLGGSLDILTKIVLRCTCDYYAEFQHLASVYTRANSEHHVTIGDLVDNHELMAYNQKMGPLFDRTPESVRGAGSRLTNMGTGEPHKSWLPYRHKDHHLPNKEVSLHQRSTTAKHEERARRTVSKSLDFDGSAGVYASYADNYRDDKWERDDVLWQRSFCSAPYFRRPHGGDTQKHNGQDARGGGEGRSRRHQAKRKAHKRGSVSREL
jgi:hypothetical protein